MFVEDDKEMVGLSGFEPPTSPTPKECATGLRHSPNGHTLSEVGKRIKCLAVFDTKRGLI